MVLILALVGYNFLRRRREEADFDQVLQPTDDEEPRSPAPAPVTTIHGGTRAETGRDAIVVEESEDDSGEFIAPPPMRTSIRPTPVPVAPSIDDTLSSETALNLEQADPLAEADFHMAYGLYDQAADIVKLAIGREPGRRDLRLKLLEVYFVWGNKDSFLEVARELGRTRDAAAAGEWDKVGIMGRQIAADDPLFAGAVGRTAAADVDLDLDAGGPQGVDLELIGEPSSGTTVARSAHAGFDLDFGHALKGSDSGADTGPNQALDPDRLDLVLDRPLAEDRSGATTREMRPRVEAPTVEQPTLRPPAARDVPTVESPALSGQVDQTIREKLDTALRRDRGSQADATAELSLDDLGFEIDKLSTSSTSLESLAVTDHPSDAPTMVAGLDAKSRSVLDAAARRAADLEPTRESPRAPAAPAVDDESELLPTGEDTDLGIGHADTGTVERLAGGDLDLDLDELARALESDTAEQPRREEMKFSTDVFQTGLYKAQNGLDVDVGAPLKEQREPTVTERIATDDMALPDLEPVTLSEVGTKLDLARAYMDMGDPDGARSILQEVLSEGSASQKQEAQRLIESLPG